MTIEKNAPETRMLAEIHEQPEVLARVLEGGWEGARTAGRALREEGFRSVMLAARGTSDNAALYAKYLFETVLGVPAALASPSVFTLYGANMKLDGVLVVGIRQSGESKDVLETGRRARDLGARTLSITNDEGSSMAGAADHHLHLRAGEEKSVAATKTYTASLLLLFLLVEALKGGESPGAEARDLPEKAQAVLGSAWGRPATVTPATWWWPRGATTCPPPRRRPSS